MKWHASWAIIVPLALLPELHRNKDTISKTDANLDCALVKITIVFLVPKFGRGGQGLAPLAPLSTTPAITWKGELNY